MANSINAYADQASVGSGENVKAELEAPDDMDVDNVNIAATRASTSFDVNVIWCDDDFNELVTENISSGVAAGNVDTSSTPARSRHCKVQVADAGSGSGAVDFTATFD